MRIATIFYSMAAMLSLSHFSVGYAMQTTNVDKDLIRVLVGRYSLQKNYYMPLILTSDRSAMNWNLQNNLPSKVTLADVACTSSYCVAVGSGWLDDNNNNPPVFFVSSDAGKTWIENRNISGMPKAMRTTMQSISCSANFCAATGYDEVNNTPQPLLLTSQDQGQSWSVKKIKNAVAKEGKLQHVTCSENYCAAISNYYSVGETGSNLPLLSISQDQGKTWTKVNIKPLVKKLQHVEFSTIKSQGNKIVITGTYSLGKPFEKYGYILTSKDAGKTWNAVKNITGLGKRMIIKMNDINFSTHTILIAGGYHDKLEVPLPLMIVSKDQGDSWSLVNNINTNHLGELMRVSCTADTCITGSDSYSILGRKFDPAFVSSQDGGLTWSPINDSFNIRYLGTIDCADGSCLIAGDDGVFGNTRPVMMLTTDSGQTWMPAKNVFGLPSHLRSLQIIANANQQ